MEELQTQLKDNSEAHAAELSMLDRKKAIEIDQLKKEMLQKIRETRDALRLKTRDQLDATTKRTIMENEQMTTELHFQSRETERLLERNAQLTDGNRQLKRNLLIHKELEDELARRTHVYQKLIRKLHQRLKTISLDESREFRSMSQDDNSNQQRGRGVGQDSEASFGRDLRRRGGEDDGGDPVQMAAMKEKVERVGKENEELQQTLHMVRYEFAQYRRDHATLTQLQDQSARLVIAALYDLKNQVESGPLPDPGPLYCSKCNAGQEPSRPPGSDWSTMSNRQREHFFRMLLEKLNQSLCSTCMPAGSDLAQQSSVQAKSSGSLPPITKAPSFTAGGGSVGPGQQQDFDTFLRSITLSDGPGQGQSGST